MGVLAPASRSVLYHRAPAGVLGRFKVCFGKGLVVKAVTQFFGSYFHQDWGFEAGSADEVIAGFLRENSNKENLKTLATQIRQYLATEKDDEAMECGLYGKLDCNYAPERDGMTARQWLSHVADMFEDAIQKKEHHDSFLPAAVSDQASRQGLKRKRADEG